MTDPNSEVEIDPQTASNGIAAWNQAAATLSSRYRAAIDAITAKNAAKPWGADSAGTEFEASWRDSGGLTADENGGEVVEQVVDLGPRVRRAVENSLSSDADQGRVMDIEVEGL